MQRRAIYVAGLAICNELPVDLRLMHRALTVTFFSNLKTVLFSRGWVGSASE